MNWYIAVLSKYAVFQGRASRPEFWLFTLVNLVIVIILGLLSHGKNPWNYLVIIYFLATFLPNLGVHVRRLHDSGRSGWWFLIHFIPYIGSLIMIYFMLQPSQPGDNQYGQNQNYNVF